MDVKPQGVFPKAILLFIRPASVFARVWGIIHIFQGCAGIKYAYTTAWDADLPSYWYRMGLIHGISDAVLSFIGAVLLFILAKVSSSIAAQGGVGNEWRRLFRVFTYFLGVKLASIFLTGTMGLTNVTTQGIWGKFVF